LRLCETKTDNFRFRFRSSYQTISAGHNIGSLAGTQPLLKTVLQSQNVKLMSDKTVSVITYSNGSF